MPVLTPVDNNDYRKIPCEMQLPRNDMEPFTSEQEATECASRLALRMRDETQ